MIIFKHGVRGILLREHILSVHTHTQTHTHTDTQMVWVIWVIYSGDGHIN